MAAWTAYLTAFHLLERHVEEQLKADAGLTHAQYEILVMLSAAPGRRLRMSELARRVVVSRSGLTYQVGRLETMGLVARETCASDERGVLAVLTAEGAACLERTAPGHVAVVRELMIDLLDRDELETMTRAMRKMEAAMRRSPAPPADG
ncbi:MarR family transcriptional regulator [Planomonospora alba]|uniref:MarR family transcriptional regulator n=2 Tax=Planomonospora alba TaxID=161354 RepID=A0ABP6NHY2_9ACTN